MRDGAEALDYLYRRGAHREPHTSDPAVVLLDLKLPKVDGLRCWRRSRPTRDLQAYPVVMLTSSREESDLVRSYELGVNAYVVKPVGFREFFDAIQDLGVFWAILNEPPPRRNGRLALPMSEQAHLQSSRELRILLLEDSALDAELVTRGSGRRHLCVRCERVDLGGRFPRLCEEERWDLILADYCCRRSTA